MLSSSSLHAAILGVTNPYFEQQFSAWSHRIHIHTVGQQHWHHTYHDDAPLPRPFSPPSVMHARKLARPFSPPTPSKPVLNVSSYRSPGRMRSTSSLEQSFQLGLASSLSNPSRQSPSEACGIKGQGKSQGKGQGKAHSSHHLHLSSATPTLLPRGFKKMTEGCAIVCSLSGR